MHESVRCDCSQEDLGVEIFSPNSVFNLTMPLIGKYQPIPQLGPAERSQCEYNQTTGRYCAPLKAVITASLRENVQSSDRVSQEVAQQDSPTVLRPRLSFTVSGFSSALNNATIGAPPPAEDDDANERVGSELNLIVQVHGYSEAGGVGEVLVELPLSAQPRLHEARRNRFVQGRGSTHRFFQMETLGFFRASALSPTEEWVAVTVENRGKTLSVENLTVDAHYTSDGGTLG